LFGPNRVKPEDEENAKKLAGVKDVSHERQYQPYDVMPGDKVNRRPGARSTATPPAPASTTGVTATSLVLLAISGLSLFHPSLYFLTALSAAGFHPLHSSVDRAWCCLRFLRLFLRFWRANLWEGADNTWLARISDVLRDKEEKLPEVGKYNAGRRWSSGRCRP